MSRIRQALFALIAVALLSSPAAVATAQPATELDPVLRAELAAITLDQLTLPEGFRLSGEAFLGVDQVGSELDADALDEAGFIAMYASAYTNVDTGLTITSYVSAWSDAETATAGFDMLEDHAVSGPSAALTDADTSIGETPREITSGTIADPADPSRTLGVVDVTFRVDNLLVGVAVTSDDGTVPEASLAESLAATLEGRATAVLGGESPEGTDLTLVPRILPVGSYGPELQAGFIDAADAELMYELRGSALGRLGVTWAEVAGLGDDGAAPYVAIGVSLFDTPEDALAVFEQVGELAPPQEGVEIVDGVDVTGASATTALTFPSLATSADDADSARVFALVSDVLVVVDIQGATDADAALAAAAELASAQVACLGAASCEAPELPDGLS